MTSVICEAHREVFSQDRKAAQQAFEQLARLLHMVRQRRVDAPILAIHHARLEIAHIQLQNANASGLAMMRTILRDLAQQQPIIPVHALHYFLDMAREALADCAFFSFELRDEAQHLLSSLALLHELPDELLCRALSHMSEPHTMLC